MREMDGEQLVRKLPMFVLVVTCPHFIISHCLQCRQKNEVFHFLPQHRHPRMGGADPSASGCLVRIPQIRHPRRKKRCSMTLRPSDHRANDWKAQNPAHQAPKTLLRFNPRVRTPRTMMTRPPPQNQPRKVHQTLRKLAQSPLMSSSLCGQSVLNHSINVVSPYLFRVCDLGCYKVPQQFHLIEEDLARVADDRWLNTAVVDFTVA